MSSLQTVVICISSPGAPADSPCGADQVMTTMQAYVSDSPDTSGIEHIDPATASGVFLAAFSAVLVTFLIARSAGTVLNMIRAR